MPVGAALGGVLGSDIGGALIGAGASIFSGNRAAGAATAAANSANQTQLQMFHEANALNAPWRNAGSQAVNLLGQGLIPGFTSQGGPVAGGGQGNALWNAFTTSPDYQFRLQQGQQQLDRLAARGGNFFSGRALQDAASFGQGLAGQEYGNYINRLQSLAGLGSSAAGQSAGNAISTGQGLASNMLAAGGARQSAYLNQGNAITGLINQYYRNQPQAPSSSGGWYQGPWS